MVTFHVKPLMSDERFAFRTVYPCTSHIPAQHDKTWESTEIKALHQMMHLYREVEIQYIIDEHSPVVVLRHVDSMDWLDFRGDFLPAFKALTIDRIETLRIKVLIGVN